MNILVIIFFLFGLIIGSFLNVLVYRLHDAETILGRSMCRHCRHQIRWYDNIPLISFVLLAGKCRDCQGKIAWQYPFFEFLTGIFFALTAAFFLPVLDTGNWAEFIWLLVIISLFLTIAVYDIKYMEIPLILLVVSAGVTLLFLLSTWHSGEHFLTSELGLGIFGGLAVALFFFALVYASRETWMGWGDVWLGGVAGMIVGLPLVLFMLTLSFGFGAIVGLIQIRFSGKNLKTQIPFAPYLVVGVLLTIFLPKIFPRIMDLFLLV